MLNKIINSQTTPEDDRILYDFVLVNAFYRSIGTSESIIREQISEIFDILLIDRTKSTANKTKNIIWANDNYLQYDNCLQHNQNAYIATAEMTSKLINGEMGCIIMPRALKSQCIKKERTKLKAEVFTPIWIVKKQNSLAEQVYFNDDVADNDSIHSGLDDYIACKWLEITCGEAPYMTTRYDMETGNVIAIENREGFIDRKLKLISTEINNKTEWHKLAVKAYQASYGFEWNGDSLLLARKNLLYSYSDYYFNKWQEYPSYDLFKSIAEIISYNLFQMNGINCRLPLSETEGDSNNKPVKVMNWTTKQMEVFDKGLDTTMKFDTVKFDMVIGNPPYQDMNVGKNNQATPIYHHFYELAEKVSTAYLLITPARFLSNQGATPKAWNRKMLSDKHLDIKYFNARSDTIFPNVDIKGGVVILCRNKHKDYGAIETFIPFDELKSIFYKVKKVTNTNISNLLYSPDSYRFTEVLFDENPNLMGRTDKSHAKAVASSVFTRYSEIFFENKPDNNDDYIQIFGRLKSKRTSLYIKRNYLKIHKNLDKWKVFVAGASGKGGFGEALSLPIIGEPSIGHTQTFVSIGHFDTQFEAESLLKYIQTKFARSMLGIMKTTQNNQSKNTWSKVPIQDFTPFSDIDWSKSTSQVDQQLYEKYQLNHDEINFIECNVTSMEK